MASSDAKLNTISQPYRFELELISERPDLDYIGLLHRPAFLAFSPDGLGIHGIIYQVAQGESGTRKQGSTETRVRSCLLPQSKIDRSASLTLG